MKRLFLLDPNLEGFTGHYANHARVFSEYCQKNRIAFYCLGARPAKSIKGIANMYPVFTDRSVSVFRTKGDAWQVLYRYARQLSKDLQSFFKKKPHKKDDVLLIQNAHVGHLMGWLKYLKNAPVKVSLKLYVQFFYFPNNPPYQSALSLEVIQTLFLSTIRQLQEHHAHIKLYFATEDHQQSAYYSSFLGQKTGVLPVPLDWEVSPFKNKYPVTSPLKIFLPGAARLEKGFDWLPMIAEAFIEELESQKIEFYFQSHFHPGVKDPYLLEIRKKLQNKKGICLLDKPMSREDYRHAMKSSDIIIFPFKSLRYEARGSGTIIEALCAGKPVIVPDNTFLSRKLAQYGTGLVFKYESCDDFIRQLRHMIANIQKGFVADKRKQNACIKAHKPETFFSLLKSLKETRVKIAWMKECKTDALEEHLKRLLPWLFERLKKDNRHKVYVFGAGSHTCKMLPVWLNLKGPEILGIIDPAADHTHTHIMNIPLIEAHTASEKDLQHQTAWVLSSAVYEDQLKRKALQFKNEHSIYSIWKPFGED